MRALRVTACHVAGTIALLLLLWKDLGRTGVSESREAFATARSTEHARTGTEALRLRWIQAPRLGGTRLHRLPSAALTRSHRGHSSAQLQKALGGASSPASAKVPSLQDLPLTLVVNLDRSPERWSRCSEEFSKEGIAVERFSATDGKALTPRELQENCTRSAQWLCTKGMLGCFLSHRRIWARVDSKSLPAAIVLEDDVRLYPGFASKVAGLMAELPADWDICLLGAVACKSPDVEPWFLKLYGYMLGGGRRSPGKTRRISPNLCVPFRPAGTHAYMVSLRGARKLLARLPKAQYHVDLSAWALPDLRLFAASEVVATQSFDNDSTVSKAGDPVTRRFLRWCWSILRISSMVKMCGIEDIQWVWKVAIFALPVPFVKGRRLAVDLGPSSSIWIMLLVLAGLLRSTRLLGIAIVYQGFLLCLCRYLCGTWSTRFFLLYSVVAGVLFSL